MQNNPNSIKGSIKLKPLSNPNINKDAYDSGFIDLPSVEPSLGLPTGTTNTIPNSAYYFPVIGVDPYYANSRKFTGDDSLVLKNGNLGINNSNPVYNIDIKGSLNVLSGANIPTLSATNLVPSSISNTLSVGYPGGVYFNSDTYFNNNNFVKNLTATNLFANYLSANSLTYNNKITITYTLSNASLTSLNLTGNLTANNIFVLSSLRVFSVSANNLFTNSLTANNATVVNQLSVGGDIYASNLHGFIDLDPNSSLIYKGNALSINTSNSYAFAIRPSDSYSTDDASIQRTYFGAYDANTSVYESGISKPFFKTIWGAVNYVKNYNLAGVNLTIYIDEDIVEGESQRPAIPNANDNSGTYYGSNEHTGNINGAFYSTEWLGSRYPAMTAAGIKGGQFFWSADGVNTTSGFQRYVYFNGLNFKNIYINGRTEVNISKNLNLYNPPLKVWAGYKVFDTPPPKVSFRTYFNNTLAASGNFGDQNNVYSTWLALSGNVSRFTRPFEFDIAGANFNIENVILEFDSNALDTSALMVYGGKMNLGNVTIATLGTAPYHYGAACAYNSLAWITFTNGAKQTDPFYYNNPTYYNNRNSSNGVLTNQEPNYYPGYFAVVGNPKSSNPTAFTRGILLAQNGGTLQYWDYGTPMRNFGYLSMVAVCPILDGNFNTTSFYRFEAGSTGYDTTALITSGTSIGFGLSSYDYSYQNGSPSPFITSRPLNFKLFDLKTSFNTINFPNNNTLAPWEFNGATPAKGTSYRYYAPFNFNGKYNADSTYDPYNYTPTNQVVNLSAYIYGDYTNAISNQFSNAGNDWKFYYRPLSAGNGQDNNSSMVNFDYYFRIRSPQQQYYVDPSDKSTTYKLSYYKTSTR